MKSVDAKTITIRDLFKKEYGFRIPLYQRPFSWSVDQAEELWEDVQRESDIFFLGPIVLSLEDFKSKRDTFADVVDGQQRLTTITILFAAIRDFARIEDAARVADYVNSNFIAQEQSLVSRASFKLKTYKKIEMFFEDNIQIGPMRTGNNKAEEKRVTEIYNFFRSSLESRFGRQKKMLENSLNLFVDHMERLEFILVEVENDQDAYNIFETLNSRGLDLSAADLVKNHIFKQIKAPEAELEKLSEDWLSIESNVADSSYDMQRFLRYYWISRYEFCGSKELFKKIKESKIDPRKLLKELTLDSEVLESISLALPNDLIASGYDQSLKANLEAIKILKVKQCYVLLLSLFRNEEISKPFLSKFLSLIEKFSFCYSTIGKQQANKLENIYSRYAIELDKLSRSLQVKQDQNKIAVETLYNKLRNELVDIMPPKDSFIANFATVKYRANYESKNLIRYIFSKIESSRTKGFLINYQDSNIEHIYPQNHKTKPSYDVQLIGNLTILTSDDNTKASNKAPGDKVQIFQDSKFSLNKRLSEMLKEDSTWSSDSNQKRAYELGEIAYDEVWKL